MALLELILLPLHEVQFGARLEIPSALDDMLETSEMAFKYGASHIGQDLLPYLWLSKIKIKTARIEARTHLENSGTGASSLYLSENFDLGFRTRAPRTSGQLQVRHYQNRKFSDEADACTLHGDRRIWYDALIS